MLYVRNACLPLLGTIAQSVWLPSQEINALNAFCHSLGQGARNVLLRIKERSVTNAPSHSKGLTVESAFLLLPELAALSVSLRLQEQIVLNAFLDSLGINVVNVLLLSLALDALNVNPLFQELIALVVTLHSQDWTAVSVSSRSQVCAAKNAKGILLDQTVISAPLDSGIQLAPTAQSVLHIGKTGVLSALSIGVGLRVTHVLNGSVAIIVNIVPTTGKEKTVILVPDALTQKVTAMFAPPSLLERTALNVWKDIQGNGVKMAQLGRRVLQML